MRNFQTWQRGFSLLEVLVSLLILMVGLLGIAGLMVKGQRASFEAYQRQQALALAQDMAEKIRSNRGGAPFYVTNGLVSQPGEGQLFSARQGCDASRTCTQEQLALDDLAAWDGLLAGTSKIDVNHRNVGGIIGARGCVEWANLPPDPANDPTFVVSVAWQGDMETTAPTSSSCGEGQYGSAAKRRLVSLTVSGCRLNGTAPWGCVAGAW